MRRPLLVMLSAALAAGCGGRAAAPEAAPARTPTAAPAGDPSTLRYAPGTGRYRFEQTQNFVQEVMGQTQEITSTTNLLVTAAFTAGQAGNLNAAFTIDSVSMTASMGNPAALDALRGKTFRAVFAPNGRTVSYTPPDSSAVTLQGADMFREFLPTLPAGPLTAGMTWIDTTNAAPAAAQGLTIRTQAIRTHRLVGWEPRDGARALHITTVGNYTISGEGEQNGAALTMRGTGIATSERFISAAGTYLGNTTTDSANITVNVASMGLDVPVRQTRRSAATRLP